MSICLYICAYIHECIYLYILTMSFSTIVIISKYLSYSLKVTFTVLHTLKWPLIDVTDINNQQR